MTKSVLLKLWRYNSSFTRCHVFAESQIITPPCSSGVPRNFFRWGESTISVADIGQRERGSGGGSPLVRGSAQFSNEWNPYSYLVITDVFSTKHHYNSSALGTPLPCSTLGTTLTVLNKSRHSSHIQIITILSACSVTHSCTWCV
jgi:hypothetical protein